jgi:dienelactone hydrolase
VAVKVKNLVDQLGRPGPYDVKVGDLGVTGLPGRIYVPVEGSGGAGRVGRRGRISVPGLVFGHDWCTGVDAYHVTLRHLASWGIAVAAPDTETGFVTDHAGFAADLESSLQVLTGVTFGSGTTVTDSDRLYLAGHGMGAGAAVLTAAGRAPAGQDRQNRPSLRGVIAVYPSDTTPSCYGAARRVETPGLVLDAGRPGTVPVGNASRLAANWRGPVVYRRILKGSPAGFSEPILRKALLGGAGPEFGVQDLLRALMVGFITGDGALDSSLSRDCATFHDPETAVKGTATATRRELFESLPEFGDPVDKLQQALLKL